MSAPTAAFLGIDLGGTSVKVGVFDRAGNTLALTRRPLTPTCPAPGQAEIPIESIYAAARECVREVTGNGRIRVVALAISSQGQTFVTLDEQDRPLHQAIVWYDSRAARQAAWLNARIPRDVAWRPHLETISTVSKVLWLREQAPERMRRARRYLLLPEYLAYRLTGRAVTDLNTASSTGLFAEGAPGYCQAALEAAGIPEDHLAGLEAPGKPIGPVTGPAAEEWGLSPSTLMVAGTNDQYAGALGAGNCRPGILSETSGTCLALVTLSEHLSDRLPPGLLSGVFPISPYRFALAYCKTSGVVLDWFRREFCGRDGWEQLREMAAAVPIGCRGITMLPYFDGCVSPVPDPEMRGVFAGLALHHTRADLYRAILEALAFSLRENLALMEENGLRIDVVRSIGGGARDDLWQQIKADVIGRSIERPAVTEAAVLGAAMLAAAGAGEFESVTAVSKAWYRTGQVFVPDEARRLAYEEPYRRYRKLAGRT